MHTILRDFLFTCMLGAMFMLPAHSQTAAIKTNLFYWGTASPNLQFEFSLSKRTTLELGGGINTFVLKRADGLSIDGTSLARESKFKHWLVQPELRYWPCEVFNGSFFGLHLHGAQYNVGGLDIPLGRLKNLKDHRYEGYLYGGGISYGYQWIISPRWNFELSIGGGFARVHYSKFPCTACGTKLDESDYNYLGVTKASLSLIYFFK